MDTLYFCYKNAQKFIGDHEVESIKPAVLDAAKRLKEKTGDGKDFLGWIDLPVNYDKEEFARIKKAAEKIRNDSDILFVIGIGGSYLGARAAIDFVKHSFYNDLPKEKRKAPQIYYVGNSMSGAYIEELIDLIGDKDFSVNVISKSGTTTEAAVAFRVFRELTEKKYGKEGAAKRIYSTTDKARGALKTLSDEEGYECFIIPDDVGGRFSVLTAVGLLPIAASGADIDKLMEGAAHLREICLNNDFSENPALRYANYEPSLHFISEWWKQLYGESEGKDQKGIFPASVDLTTDLHSMGQFIQDGSRLMYETVLVVEKPRRDFTLKSAENDIDGLNYLSGKTMDYVNKCAMKGTIAAHVDGNVPTLLIEIPEQTEYHLGELFYFFEFAVGVSGYMLGINPFDQPGVEFYKANMFRLLGKPGAK